MSGSIAPRLLASPERHPLVPAPAWDPNLAALSPVLDRAHGLCQCPGAGCSGHAGRPCRRAAVLIDTAHPASGRQHAVPDSSALIAWCHACHERTVAASADRWLNMLDGAA